MLHYEDILDKIENHLAMVSEQLSRSKVTISEVHDDLPSIYHGVSHTQSARGPIGYLNTFKVPYQSTFENKDMSIQMWSFAEHHK